MKCFYKYLTFTTFFVLSIVINSSCVRDNNNFVEATRLKTIVLDSWGNESPNLLIDIPTNYKTKMSKGPDFDIHYVLPIDTTEKSLVKMGIFVGHNPSTFANKQKDSPIIKRSTKDGISWDYWYSIKNTDTLYNCERIVYNFYKGTKEKDLKLHIFILAKNEKLLNQFLEYSNTLRLEKSK